MLNLIKQPNRWSCGLASLSMILNVDMPSLIIRIGHDGSAIIFQEEEEPFCRRSFVMPELVDAALYFGYALVPIQPLATIEHQDEKSHKWVDVYADPEAQLDRYLKHTGLIVGRTALDKPHMFAWDGEYVYDPTQPSKYKLDNSGIGIDELHILFRIK